MLIFGRFARPRRFTWGNGQPAAPNISPSFGVAAGQTHASRPEEGRLVRRQRLSLPMRPWLHVRGHLPSFTSPASTSSKFATDSWARSSRSNRGQAAPERRGPGQPQVRLAPCVAREVPRRWDDPLCKTILGPLPSNRCPRWSPKSRVEMLESIIMALPYIPNNKIKQKDLLAPAFTARTGLEDLAKSVTDDFAELEISSSVPEIPG